MLARALIAVVGIVGATVAWPSGQAGPPSITIRDWEHAVERALDGGRFREAHALLVRAGDEPALVSGAGRRVLARLRVKYALELTAWPELAHLPIELFPAEDTTLYWYARGLGAARAAWPGGGAEWIDMAREAAAALETLAGNRPSRAGVWRVSILAAIAAAQEERDELALLLAYARDLDRRLDAADVDPVEGAGALEFLAGDLWWQVSRFDAAAEAYRRSVEIGGGSPRRLLGLARADAALGQFDAARQAATRFLDRWSRADTGRPEVAEAAMIARTM
jgi:tetratricopeptide (TPR) repeat protein